MTALRDVAVPPSIARLIRPSQLAVLLAAIDRCGPDIDGGTAEQIIANVRRAERQLDRVEATWARYTRRFAQPGAGIDRLYAHDAAPMRLRVRDRLVRAIFTMRVDRALPLLRDPVGGDA